MMVELDASPLELYAQWRNAVMDQRPFLAAYLEGLIIKKVSEISPMAYGRIFLQNREGRA